MIIFDKIKQYNHKGSFEGWLKRVTINTVLQKYRAKAPLQVINDLSDEIEIEEEFSLEKSVLDVDVLLGFIQQLPDRYRMVFNLYVLDDYSHKEISKMLEISEGTSKSNLSRARKILKNQVAIHQNSTQNK